MSRHVFLEKDIFYSKKKLLEEITQPHMKALLRQFDGKHKLNNVYSAGDTLSSRKETAFYKRWKTVISFSLQIIYVDQARQLKKSYDVEVAVLIDESVWKLYSPLVRPLNPAATV
ncbi:hypothetical protein CHS0354_001066 [Potamilus streckersoni]|uniref:Uncharacterized protein n=1 Tax=Potamilus streckersoni TaxID=2493646 RepID=A0AAE0W2U2_9BIVA|nr:hypothetical protein CHS0354_001066 [Potamilus streckersoni]